MLLLIRLQCLQASSGCGQFREQKSAIAGETYEYSEMYPGFARVARDEGFEDIGEWFETLAKAERSHAGRFAKGLDTVH